jgi:ATP-dependent Clp protease ATP-binding subunit ClpC
MFERYTESARRALFFARYEVSLVGATSIEPEHVLVGAARAASGGTARLLEQAGLSADGIRAELAAGGSPVDQVPTSQEVPFSPPAQRVLQFTADEADSMGHAFIGIEHLLMGLLRESGSSAAALLGRHGVELTSLRTAIQAMATGSPIHDLSSEIAQIQASVDALATVPADSAEARELRRRIRQRLEDIKRQFRG